MNTINRLDDNARIVITSVVNTEAKVDASDGQYLAEADDTKNSGEKIVEWRAYEFLSTDNGLDGLDLTSYERFSDTGTKAKNFIPQVYLLQDLIDKAGETPPNASEIKNLHDSIMTTLFKKFSQDV